MAILDHNSVAMGRRILASAKQCLLLPVAALVLPSSSANAVITLTEINEIHIGMVLEGPANRAMTLRVIGDIVGPNKDDHIGGQQAGLIRIEDDGPAATIEIQAAVLTEFGGFSVNQVLCLYDYGEWATSQVRCDNAAMVVTSSTSVDLSVGIDFSTTQTHNGGDIAGAELLFDVVFQ